MSCILQLFAIIYHRHLPDYIDKFGASILTRLQAVPPAGFAWPAPGNRQHVLPSMLQQYIHAIVKGERLFGDSVVLIKRRRTNYKL